jgi:hypothetical protein
VCVDVVKYTVKQCAFLVKSYVECGSAREYHRKFYCKFPRNTVPSTTGTRKPIKKVLLVHFLTRNLLNMPCAH